VGKKGKGRGKDRARGERKRDRGAARGRLGGAASGPPHDVAGPGTAERARSDVDPHELARRLSSLGLRIVREAALGDGAGSLTAARLSVLGLLVLGGPRRLGELAASENVRPPTMTRLVSALEGEGLVRRERGGRDGRAVMVRATEAGSDAFRTSLARHAAPLAERLAHLPAGSRRSLDGAAAILEEALRAPAADGTTGLAAAAASPATRA
jgi:DNA-binding MarR family transcriptional regulator